MNCWNYYLLEYSSHKKTVDTLLGGEFRANGRILFLEMFLFIFYFFQCNFQCCEGKTLNFILLLMLSETKISNVLDTHHLKCKRTYFFSLQFPYSLVCRLRSNVYCILQQKDSLNPITCVCLQKKRTHHRIMAPRHYMHACSHSQTQGKSSLTTAAVTSARCDVERHYRPSLSHGGNLCEGVTGVSVRGEGECISGLDRLRDSRGELQRLPAVKTWLRGRHCNIMFTLLSRAPRGPPAAVWTSP